MTNLTAEIVEKLPYVQFMALLDEVNRPPGGKNSIIKMIQGCFINSNSKVLDVGCNTGYCAFEVAHLSKAKVTGVDISPEMIDSAKRYQANDPLGELLDFQTADGMNLPFQENTFDVVFSGGSTAFIEDKVKALREYTRVAKPWGFIVDIVFFNHTTPPESIINQLNDLMGINIIPWDMNYWLEVYKKSDLEIFSVFSEKVKLVTEDEIEDYCHQMSKEKKYPEEVENAIYLRLKEIMKLFSESHKYLSYAVFINRKTPWKEQVTLFDK